MILIALGANLLTTSGSSPYETGLWATRRLTMIEGLALLRCSPWYVSAPIPPSDQPDYVNSVLALTGDPDPARLLAELHAIEAEAGRTRGLPNAARTLDLDLIDVNGQVRAAWPILPHPRAHERAFVLLPIADIAPDWVHPTLHRTAAELAAGLPPQRIARL